MKLKEVLVELFSSCASYKYEKECITWQFKNNFIDPVVRSVLLNKIISQGNWVQKDLVVLDEKLQGSIVYRPIEPFAKETLEEIIYSMMNPLKPIKNSCVEIQLGEPTTCLSLNESKGKMLNMKPDIKEIITIRLKGETFDLPVEGCASNIIQHILSVCVEEINTLTAKITDLDAAAFLVEKQTPYGLIYELQQQIDLYGEIFERVGSIPIKDA